MIGYEKVIKEALGVKPHETVMVLTDEGKIEIGQKLHEEAKKIAKESYLLVMKKRLVSGEQLPKEVEEMMKIVDVVIAPTSVSMTHTKAKVAAIKVGTRVASMPGITEDMFEEGAILADYDFVLELTDRLTKILDKAKTARIEKGGKVLNFNLEGRPGVPSPGVYRNPGEAGNLPSGEAYIAPLEDGVNGELIVDGSMVGIGLLENPLYITIENGKIKNLKGDDKNQLSILFENENNHTVAELGIGTNPKARLTGIILEDEKIYGTVHVAFGTNTGFGGKNQATCHLDGIVLKPTLYIDNILIMKDGVFKI